MSRDLDEHERAERLMAIAVGAILILCVVLVAGGFYLDIVRIR